MGQFLNSKEPYDRFKSVMNGIYFVDKSDILEELIPALIERGYQLVTVSELLNAKEITPVAGSVYSRVLSTENVAS